MEDPNSKMKRRIHTEMKKFLALLLALVMVFALAACGTPAADPSDTPDDGAVSDAPSDTPDDTPDDTNYRVAMITDYGDITDQSFNQTTYEACKEFCEANGLDFNYFKPSSDNDADRIAMVESAIDEGYNVIVMPGYAFANTIKATAETYSDVTFIALDVGDGDLNPTDENGELIDEYYELPANAYSAVYQEELCGYMAGYAAVKLGYTKLGFLGGMAVPAVVRYGYGFVQGVDAAAKELDINVEMKYVYGGLFYGSADITAVMDTWYSQGTEVVFACGGGVYTSAAEAAAKVNGKLIGVDVDQSGIIDGAYGEGMTVTSAMKGLAPTVKYMLGEVLAGNFANHGGKIETLGLVSGDDPEANYVQIPMESTQWSDSFTQDDYKALVAGMFDGTIVVSNDTTAEPAVTNVVVDYQGQIVGG